MNLHNILVLLFFIGILLKPFYLFPSGSIGLADIVLMFAAFLAFMEQKRSGKGVHLFREDIPFYLFVLFAIMINGWYFWYYGNRDFLRYSMYWVYCTVAIWTFRVLYSRRFMRGLAFVCGVNILIQAGLFFSGLGRYFYEGWGGSRFMGTFNDPNQFAFFIFTMVLVIFMEYRGREERTVGERILFLLCFVIGIVLVACSKSTGMFLGLLVFFVVLLWQWFRDRMCRSGRRIAWQFSLVFIILLSVFALWLVWPKPEFDISQTDYTLLSRIQQKIWKLSNGNLADLLYDRSAERLILKPWYLLYGAGEGYFERFIPWGFEARLSPGVFHVFHVNEIHSSLFDVWFSYGLIPTVLLSYWVIQNAARCKRCQRAAVIALLAESFTLMNLRQPFFWFILVMAGMMAKEKREPGRSEWVKKDWKTA